MNKILQADNDEVVIDGTPNINDLVTLISVLGKRIVDDKPVFRLLGKRAYVRNIEISYEDGEKLLLALSR
jgi:hypothetical protein